LGIAIDSRRNARRAEGVQEISTADSRVKVLVIPTDEELRIAQETKKAVEKWAG
jgi:acetate kinase